MVKKILVLAVSLNLLWSASSCHRTIMSAVDYTVEHQQKTDFEKLLVAESTGIDMWEKFVFENGGKYDIQIHFYQNGSYDIFGEMTGISTSGKDEPICISGRKDGNVDFVWSISKGDILNNYIASCRIDDDRQFLEACGIGQSKILLEEDNEYVLVYFVFKEGLDLPISLTERFLCWDTIEDKTEALKDFDYAYVVTVRVNDV